jgi:MobA/MobL family.
MYHLTIKNLNRKQNQSAIAAAAYRSGERLYDSCNRLTHDFTRKKGIVHTEILLPQNAPTMFYDRELLWNAVEWAEKRCDSRTAREVEIALPNELTLTEHKNLIREFITENFVRIGMCADICIHDKQDGNPHAHILLTTRPIEDGRFSDKKNRDWDKRGNISIWRKNWADMQNREFMKKGLLTRVSHESYKTRNIDREPTIHLGHGTTALSRRGIETDRSNINNAIRARNSEREEQERLRGLEREQEHIHGR